MATLLLVTALIAACTGSEKPLTRTPAPPLPPYPAAALTAAPGVGALVEPQSGQGTRINAGYEERELFASGSARTFTSTAQPAEGRWSVSPGSTQTFRTRLILRRPLDAIRFNGTVVVEWLNASSGESSPEWDYLNPELMARGFAYVGVSAQALGVSGGTSLLGAQVRGLRRSDPARYASLHHPGDAYALDVFAQVGRALRSPGALGDLAPKHYLAVGESQSAFFLTTFVDAVQPLSRAFDGFLVHSRGGGAAGLDGSVLSAVGGGIRLRTDQVAPVLVLESESDVVQLGFAGARQPQSQRVRTWEIAGAAHADAYLAGAYASALGCPRPVNDGPQHEVAQAALKALDTWVSRGTAPPSPAPLALRTTTPPVLRRDAYGNAVGGVRTPVVDVPIASLSGEAADGASVTCALFGSTTPLTARVLGELYGSPAGYLARFEHSLDAAVDAGYVLPSSRETVLAKARAVRF